MYARPVSFCEQVCLCEDEKNDRPISFCVACHGIMNSILIKLLIESCFNILSLSLTHTLKHTLSLSTLD